MRWKGLLKAVSLGAWGGGAAGRASLGEGVVGFNQGYITPFPPGVNFKKKLSTFEKEKRRNSYIREAVIKKKNSKCKLFPNWP